MKSSTEAPSADLAPILLGSLRRVIAAGGPVDEREAELLRVVATRLGASEPWARYDAIPPELVAQRVSDPGTRTKLVHAAIVAACIDTEASPAAAAAVLELARALDVRSRWLGALVHAAHRRVLPTRMALYRSSPDARRLFQRTWHEEGLLGVWRAARFVLGGGIVDPPVAWRFRQLGLLPEGSLGREFWTSMVERRLSFPGEAGGLPERMIHHDLMHVVNEYGTDPAGECELAGFYTGFTSRDDLELGFTFIMTVLTTFQLGMPVSPAFVAPARGAFDPVKVAAAYDRGRRLAVDIMGEWDYWALMPLPVAEVRTRLGIGLPSTAQSV